MQTSITTFRPTVTYSRDYAQMLQGMGLACTVIDEHYLQVGEPKEIDGSRFKVQGSRFKVQGWALHLSVIKTQVQQFMETVLILLVEERVAFRMVKDYQTVLHSLDGNLGDHQLGKIMTIYYEDDQSLVPFAQKLIAATRQFRGPAIPTDAHLGGIVYTSYEGIDPPQAAWPFQEIAPPPEEKPKKVLGNSYLIISLLKQDVKGDVFKAWHVKRFFPEKCIVKEGRRNMWADELGRDIQERIRWQYHIQKDLYGQLSVPEPYALFEENGSIYMAMQYIKGQSLGDVVQKIYKGRSWHRLKRDQKLALLGYLLQIIDQCKKLHQKGYVHRDLALANFIVNRKNTLVMIDMELAYSMPDKTPYPPFRLGTPGFMSPEQLKAKLPSEKEDIYALGAVMIELLTSLHPRKFGIVNLQTLKENMYFLTGDEYIASLISQCLHTDPQERPLLSTIQDSVEQYQQQLAKETPSNLAPLNSQLSTEQIQVVLEEGFNSLCDLMLENPIRTQYKEIEESPVPESAPAVGWYAGVSGILLVLAQANGRTPMASLKAAYTQGMVFLEQKLADETSPPGPGLYMGAAGMAMALAAGLENHWIMEAPGKAELLRLLQMTPAGLSMAHGAAGQGMAVLRCSSYLAREEASQLLTPYTDGLLAAQQKDGSWITDDATSKSAGFSLGSTGIVFYLLAYYQLFPEATSVRESVLKGLDWLSGPAKTIGNYAWLEKHGYTSINLGLDGDIAGIALCFAKAYTTLQDPAYRTRCEETLRQIPSHVVTNELSMATGLAGLGEVYLEAARAFDSEEWKTRSDWVASLILNTSYLEGKQRRRWVVTNAFPATLDLMTGTGGVLHFLLRYLHREVSLPMV